MAKAGNKKSRQHRFTVVSLFSGGMGLDLGLEAAGRYDLLACVENDAASCETIRRNRDAGRLPADLRVYEGGVEDFDPATILADLGLAPGDVDLLVGGPPCQSFSTTGRRRTVADPRGTLLWQFLRYVETIQPKFFLMENVRGLLSAALRHRPIAERPNKGGPPLADDEQPGSVMRRFASDVAAMSDTPYHMDCSEVNAVNYGLPQLRERAIFVGNRFGVTVDFPDPTHGPPGGDKPAWGTLRDAIGNLDERHPTVLDFSRRKKGFLAMVPEGSNWRSLPERVQRESMGKAFSAKGGRSG